MDTYFNPARLAEALTRAEQHWQVQHPTAGAKAAGGGRPGRLAFTIAVSRQAGTYGAAIARAVGDRLGWPVYDRELLQRIADDLGIRGTLLDSVDERHVNWLTECLEGFAAAAPVNQTSYVRHLVQTLLSLATHGSCVIVGRGATEILPIATTLRVRIVAPLEHRVEAVRREHGISAAEAARRVETTDRERLRFVRDHFRADPSDPANYDLLLNAARFSQDACADLIVAALERLCGVQTAGPAVRNAGAEAR
jgi:cytidylate kinase